jgi:hypothetical protein
MRFGTRPAVWMWIVLARPWLYDSHWYVVPFAVAVVVTLVIGC